MSPFNPTSKLTRSFLAGIAALSTVLVVSGIASLADHYGSRTSVAAAPVLDARA